MVFSMSNEMMEQAKTLGQLYTIEVVRSQSEGKIEVRFLARNDKAKLELPTLVNRFTNQLCSLFYAYCGIQGKIIDVD